MERYYTLADLAKATGLAYTTVMRRHQIGLIPAAVMVGRAYAYDKATFDSLVTEITEEKRKKQDRLRAHAERLRALAS